MYEIIYSNQVIEKDIPKLSEPIKEDLLFKKDGLFFDKLKPLNSLSFKIFSANLFPYLV